MINCSKVGIRKRNISSSSDHSLQQSLMTGHKHKLQASASCQAQRASSETGVNRFSNLPVDVAHHILSFLDFNDITRVGAVSRKCRLFYLSAPVVDVCPSWSITNQYHARLLSSLDRYLIYRGDNRMQCLRISWRFCTNIYCDQFCDAQFRVLTWIQNAVRCNVEEVDLHFEQIGLYFENIVPPLPSCIFRAQSLRSLSVELDREIFNAPSLSFSSNLHYLELRRVKMLDEGVFKWITCCCKCIKELHLSFIEGIQSITIESTSLESFSVSVICQLRHLNISGEKLENLDIEWIYSTSTRSKSLNIFAPSLKNLKWKGKLTYSQNLGNLKSLERVQMFIFNPRNNKFDKVFGILSSIRSAKVLTINKNTIEALSKEGSVPAPIFDNMRNLSIHCENLNDDLVPGMVSLLRGMPNLNILYVKTSPRPFLFTPKTSTGFGLDYWKMQNLAFIDQLKEVTIEHSHGSNEIEFARYILEHAQNLKKMVIALYNEDAQSQVVAEMVSRSKTISTAIVCTSVLKVPV